MEQQNYLEPLVTELSAEVEQLQEALRAANNRCAELEAQQEIDQFTGLHNKFGFEKRVADLIDKSRESDLVRHEHNGDFVVYFDIDGLKLLNDTYGHDAGDQAIKTTADILSRFLRRGNDVVAHLSGDEFAALITRCTAEQVKNAINRVLIEIKKAGYSISAGIAAINYSDTANTVISRADQKMYQTKNAGRNQTCAA